MKTSALLVTALLAVSVFASAQNGKKEIQTGNYEKIAISGPFTIELFSGKAGKVTVSGDDKSTDLVDVIVEDNTLKIKAKNTRKWTGSDHVAIAIPFEVLHEIDISGSTKVTSNNLVKVDLLVLHTSGSGETELAVDAQKVEVALSGSGKINLSGKAASFVSLVSGSGDLNAFDLKTISAEIKVSGSGSSRIYTSDSLVARVSGSGEIAYKGNPAKEDTQVSGSGKIVKS
jgi:hypothetical protein